MDLVLACHASGGGSNPDMPKDFSAPILSGTPLCALSLSQSLLSHASARLLVMGEGKREELW